MTGKDPIPFVHVRGVYANMPRNEDMHVYIVRVRLEPAGYRLNSVVTITTTTAVYDFS